MVLINVGMMERDNYSILKLVRGKKLPPKVGETISASEIKILPIDKHASHNQNFCGLGNYVLLWKGSDYTTRNTNWYIGQKQGETIHIM